MDGSPLKAEVPAAEYKLFVREGFPRFYFRNTNEGVYLSPKGIGWFVDGTSYTRDWSEIEAVNLTVAHIPKQGPMGSCIVAFRDGTRLSVLSASAWGGSDEERNVEYGRFITDFHRAIPKQERGAIRFSSGFSQARHAAMTVVFVVAALFFVVLPLGLAVYLRNLEALLVAAAGGAFVWPVYRMTEAAAPADYHPDSIPDDFYP
jgi:hypothetical protein